MKIKSTEIEESSNGLFVEITITDDSPPDDDDGEVILVRVEVEGAEPGWRLEAIQRAALQRVQDVVSAELRRAASPVDRLHG